MKTIKLIFGNTIVFLLLLISVESVIRSIGVEPYEENEKTKVDVKAKTQYFQKDSLLGYKHHPGQFNITLKENYEFSAFHNESFLRRTHDQKLIDTIAKEEVWLFGCSFTYGWSLNDEETFPWQLQQKLVDFKVVNWGICGYGTVHFYLQLREALRSKNKPKFVIINHADFHHERNTDTYNYRRSISSLKDLGLLKKPVVKTNRRAEYIIDYIDNKYTPWVLSTRYALGKRMQFSFEQYVDGRAFKSSLKITRYLLDRIRELCEENGVELLLTNVGLDKEFIESYALDNDVPFVDISVDYLDARYNNMPYDKHPNLKANEIYADKIFKFLFSLITVGEL